MTAVDAVNAAQTVKTHPRAALTAYIAVNAAQTVKRIRVRR
jgi:hypothetical protein